MGNHPSTQGLKKNHKKTQRAVLTGSQEASETAIRDNFSPLLYYLNPTIIKEKESLVVNYENIRSYSDS